MTGDDLERLARTAYEAHRSVQGGSLPSWEELTGQDRQTWRNAVSAVPSRGGTLHDSRAQALVVQVGDRTHTFRADFTAGRQGLLAVADEHASSHHARFLFAHGQWYVEDLDSTNGTWLNGRRVISSQRLKKSDKVRIGHSLITVVSALRWCRPAGAGAWPRRGRRTPG